MCQEGAGGRARRVKWDLNRLVRIQDEVLCARRGRGGGSETGKVGRHRLVHIQEEVLRIRRGGRGRLKGSGWGGGQTRRR